MATADLKLIYGGGDSGISPSASQPFDQGAVLGLSTISSLNISGGLTVITLTGSYALGYLNVSNLSSTGGQLDVVLTVDGKQVINKSFAAFPALSVSIFSAVQGSQAYSGVPLDIKTGMSLYLRYPPATSATLTIQAIQRG